MLPLPLGHGTKSGSRGTRTHKRREAATCFQDRLLIQPDDFRICSSSGDWNRTNGLLVQSQASLPAATTPESIAHSTRANVGELGEKDLNLHDLVQSQAAYR